MEIKTSLNKKLKLKQSLSDVKRIKKLSLNYDCLIRIFKNLPIADRMRIERVCKLWREASLASWRNFHYLDFTQECWGEFEGTLITTNMMNSLLKRCNEYITNYKVNVEYFDVEYNAVLKTLTMCRNLTSIDVSSIYVTMPNLRSIMENCENITELSIGSTPRTVNDSFLSTIFRRYRGLKIFRFLENNSIFGYCALDLPDSIEELCLEHCSRLNFYILAEEVKRFYGLRKLSLRDSICTRYFTVDFGFLNGINLKELDISENPEMIDDDTLIEIAKVCRNLTSINIRLSFSQEEIHECEFENISLIAENINISDQGFSAITSLPNLECLNIYRLIMLTDDSVKIMPRLKKLDCSDTDFSDVALIKLLHTSENIQEIVCSYCRNVSNVLITAAIEIVKSRTNGIGLKIVAKRTRINFTLTENFPLLSLEL